VPVLSVQHRSGIPLRPVGSWAARVELTIGRQVRVRKDGVSQELARPVLAVEARLIKKGVTADRAGIQSYRRCGDLGSLLHTGQRVLQAVDHLLRCRCRNKRSPAVVGGVPEIIDLSWTLPAVRLI